ncbi:MAG: hypothetical protein DCC58_20330, partial [Chloroflexi bacterium]
MTKSSKSAFMSTRKAAAGTTRSHLARKLLDEGLRMQAHPGVVFRSRPAGRRAGLALGPDIWEVARVFRQLDATGD